MSKGLADLGIGGASSSYGTMSTGSTVGFSPTELYNLSENVTTNVYTINNSLRSLERTLKNIGTNKDNQGLRDKVHVTQLSTNQIISVTSKDLKRLAVIAKQGDKQQKLQVEKLTNDFKDAVGRYSRMQKQVADRLKENLIVSSDLEYAERSDAGEQSAEEKALLLAQAQSTTRELVFEQEMLLEREKRVSQIESDILDVNQIMQELSVLIHQQGDVIDTIENGIETATGNIELGRTEIVKAASHQRSHRKKMLILLLIAAVVASVLLWILISNLKKS